MLIRSRRSFDPKIISKVVRLQARSDRHHSPRRRSRQLVSSVKRANQPLQGRPSAASVTRAPPSQAQLALEALANRPPTQQGRLVLGYSVVVVQARARLDNQLRSRNLQVSERLVSLRVNRNKPAVDCLAEPHLAVTSPSQVLVRSSRSCTH